MSMVARDSHWEDESGVVTSTRSSIICNGQCAGKTYNAIYSPPRATITVVVKDADSQKLLAKKANSQKLVAGASVYVDGVYVGATNSAGKLAVSIYVGTHQITISMDGYNTFETTIQLTGNKTLKVSLNSV
jgi:hypothetical protein